MISDYIFIYNKNKNQSKVEHSIEAEGEKWDSLWWRLNTAEWSKEDGRRSITSTWDEFIKYQWAWTI